MPPLGIYVHVPFCAARCGYCDFNTYIGLGEDDHAAWERAAVAEIGLARRELGPREVATVFFGGGTPTLVAPARLVRVLGAIAGAFGLARDAEVTVEANPDSIGPEGLRELRASGVTRMSFGMQSAVGHVLAVLDRRHAPDRVGQVVAEARVAGFEHVSVDLIYGTPGERAGDWEASLRAALESRPDHVSAYALAVEPGTALAARVRRGVVRAPDPDTAAERYMAAEALLGEAGLGWYELASWAADAGAACRHNLGYWRGADWWGVGPGAHSHVDGVRWWNVRRPATYAARLAAGESPAAGREVLDEATRRFERVMLEVRLREGLERSVVADDAAVARVVADGLAEPVGERLRLTLEGRLKADAVVRALTA